MSLARDALLRGRSGAGRRRPAAGPGKSLHESLPGERQVAAAAPSDSVWGLSACRLAGRAALLLTLSAVVAHLALLVPDLGNKDYGEGPMLAFMVRLQSEPISASWATEPPYGLSCYGPAFYYLARASARFSGLQRSLIPGRAIATAAGLLAAAIAAIVAARRTRSFESGLLAPLLFLTSLPVIEWFPYARVDTLALLFSAAAYWAVGSQARGAALPAVLIAIGSLAKPTASLTAAPILFHLLATGRYRDAARFTPLVIALGAAVWGVAQWASDGFFLTSVLKGNLNPMIPWRGYSYCYDFLSSPLGAVATVSSVIFLVASPRQFARSLYSLGYLTTLAISTVIACKKGSEMCYFLEPALVGGLALAIDAFPHVKALDTRRAGLAMALLAAIVGVPYLRDLAIRFRTPIDRPPMYEVVRRALADEPADAEVLADGKTVPTVLAAGRRPWLNDPYLYALRVANGTIDPAPLLERLADGRIQWLVLRHTVEFHQENSESWPPIVLESFARHYQVASREGDIVIYRHR